MSKAISTAELNIANDFLTFVNASPSHFHAVDEAKKLLVTAGFKELDEKTKTWDLKQNEKYFFTRNQSSVCAFAVGGKFEPGNGFSIAAAHTDSPVLKVKPVSKIAKHGYLQVGVEVYGGGLWSTWFDRDLSLAGRVIVAVGDKFETRLVHIKRPILRIPMLAIHLQRGVNEDGLKINAENHLAPVLATAVKSQLESRAEDAKSDQHHSLLLKIVASEMGVEVEAIRDFELCLYDTQAACLGGAFNEFIFSRALDNLMMSFISLKCLIDSCDSKSLAEEKQVRMVALFDNEEVGSDSYMGAGSNLLRHLLHRINGDTGLHSGMRRSFLVSADMAHALHPNYAEKHEENHRPALHKGLVIKQNANQRYATNAVTSFVLTEIAKRHNIPVQRFVVRNDTACGSTIGPILATNCGIRTVDVGVPQLSMHSIREMCGVGDVHNAYELIRAFFQEFASLDESFKSE